MAFDLTLWKQKLTAHLPGWKARMGRAGVGSTYAFLSAAALWPVVEAARSGEWAAVGAVAALTASSLGTNLLANQIQSWKDESDAARQLEKAAAQDAPLRAELDAVLQKLDALPLAEKSLGDADRAWFAETIQQELKRLGSGITYQATIISNGVVVQGKDNVGVGPRGVNVDGSVGGSINTGVVNLFFAQYQAPSGRAQLSKDSFERILEEYLNWVVKAYGKARLYGLESMRTTREQPRRQLADVFVPLALRRSSPPGRDEIEELARQYKDDPLADQRAYLWAVESRRTEGDKINIQKLLTVKDRLALIGSAGCGKSTLAAYLAAALADAALQEKKPPFALPKGRNQLLPVVVPLRYYREYQRLCSESPQERLKNPRMGTLAGLIPWYLCRRCPSLELSEDFFDRLLLGGGCLLILDGLDEVVSRAERGRVRAHVETLANDIYPGNLILVTARESGYREDAVFGDDFVRLNIQPLADEQIEALVRTWCQQLYPEAVKSQTAEILTAIGDINQRYKIQELPPLVNTPLMTTMVISVKWGENELPRERAKLYEAAVKVILQAQYLENDEAQQELVNWGGAWDEQREWLSHLALAMHRGGRDGAVILEARVREILSGCPGMSQDKLDTFIQAVRLRGGLFEERAELFQFAHLTFQEFLAARLLAKERQEGLKILRSQVTNTWWREVCLLMYGFAKEDYPPFAAQYLDWLGTLTPDENHLAGMELAASAILEIERPDPTLRRVQAERLLADIQNSTCQTSPVLRARAGNTLAKVGDPRSEVKTVEAMPFCHVPAGSFVMGSKEDDKASDDDEQPQHTLELPDFLISRYPVTNAQFGEFVAAGGYANPVYWPEATQAGVWKKRRVTSRYENKVRNRPYSFGEPFDMPNHPVVGVTWYEALAFCRWMEECLKVEERDEDDFWRRLVEGRLHVSLPSEAEWEKAARGNSPLSTGEGLRGEGGARIYPWGDDFDPNKANTNETNIGATSAMGCFPGGASPYGVLDMSGNVMEWTRSLLGDYPYPGNEKGRAERENLQASSSAPRVLRGGSFGDVSGAARCPYRGWISPVSWLKFVGFRVVVVSSYFS